jgi:hypothetical protein
MDNLRRFLTDLATKRIDPANIPLLAQLALKELNMHDTNCPVLVRNGECGHLPGCEGGSQPDQRAQDVDAALAILWHRDRPSIFENAHNRDIRSAAQAVADLIAAAREQGRREGAKQ